jgi:hypothetical protein
MQNISIGLVENNLALWTKVPNIDPETQAISGEPYYLDLKYNNFLLPEIMESN